MTPLVRRGLSLLELALLRSASLLVPQACRPEWQREWRAEVWHVRRTCAPGGAVSWRGEWNVARFCRGAFLDAWCLRREVLSAAQSGTRRLVFKGSAVKCVAALAFLLSATYWVSLNLPGVRAQVDASRYQVRPGLILIEDAHSANDELPAIDAERFRGWKARNQRYFDALAFYHVKSERIDANGEKLGNLEVAYASPSLFALLGSPVAADQTEADVPPLILSHSIWRQKFRADPGIVGSLVRIKGRVARVAGVIPEGAWRLPGRADAWLLQPEYKAAGMGYVVAHLNQRGRAEMVGNRVGITSSDTDDGEDDLWGVSFAERMRRPQDMFLFALFLALLALPAVTSVSMGEYSFDIHGSSWQLKIARWSFLIAKIALLVPGAYFASLDLAYCTTTGYSEAAVYAQLLSAFVLCLFGLRWVMLDQRQRCPVCLCRVAHPAQVGQAGQTFLAWNGTEMICRDGHTLLHVPGLPTSWFGTQRWIYLDTSWQFLFAGTEAR